jgi:signal peptide peptidase SppA
MKTEHNAAAYLLGMHGDPWAIHAERMQGYLNTLIVSDMSAEEIEKRTGPCAVFFFGEDGPEAGFDLRRQSALGDQTIAEIVEKEVERLAAMPGMRRAAKAVAVMRLLGPITQRAGLLTAFFGGTSTEKFAEAFDALMENPGIGGIVVDIDSPGGEVSGTPELSEHIFQSRGRKPVVGVANTWAASGAFFTGTAFDELVVTPSGEVGSVGVMAVHTDVSGMLEQDGVKRTVISAGAYKTERSPYAPLSDEAREEIQRMVDHHNGVFEAAVAKHRGVTVNHVQKNFGQGRMVRPKEAVAAGMADRVATLDQTIQRMQRRLGARATARAEAAARDAELRELELGGKS